MFNFADDDDKPREIGPNEAKLDAMVETAARQMLLVIDQEINGMTTEHPELKVWQDDEYGRLLLEGALCGFMKFASKTGLDFDACLDGAREAYIGFPDGFDFKRSWRF